MTKLYLFITILLISVSATAQQNEVCYNMMYDLARQKTVEGQYQQALYLLDAAARCADNPQDGILQQYTQQITECRDLRNQADKSFDAGDFKSAADLYDKILRINTGDEYSKIRQAKCLSDRKTINEELVYVAGGVFNMGSDRPTAAPDERPAHDVSVHSFYVSKYEVTNEQYAKFLNDYGSDKVRRGRFGGMAMILESKYGLKKTDSLWLPNTGYEKHPVVNITWYGAYEFCEFYGYRLPTEAEWEYAARGGQLSKKYIFSGSDKVTEVAWISANSHDGSQRVGLLHPNELGIYDMSGNVYEWCLDWYDNVYYSSSPKLNPSGATSGGFKVIRGGSWELGSNYCTVSHRNRSIPNNAYPIVGFRYVKL